MIISEFEHYFAEAVTIGADSIVLKYIVDEINELKEQLNTLSMPEEQLPIN